MRLGVVSILTLLLTSIAHAATCVPATLQGYINLGSAGCTIGTVQFYDFSLLPLSGGTTSEVDPNIVNVVPIGDASSSGLQFILNVTAGAGELLQSRFGYTLSGLPGVPVDALLSMAGSSAVPDGVTTVVEDLCLDDVFASTFCFASQQSMIVFDIGLDAQSSERLRLSPVTMLGVVTDISVDGGLAGAAAISSATNQFVIVPEPGTSALGFSALLTFFLWSRSQRRSQ